MKKLLCLILGHNTSTHIDTIYGSLFRKHTVCIRCYKTLSFTQATTEEAARQYHPDKDLDCASNISTSPYKINK